MSTPQVKVLVIDDDANDRRRITARLNKFKGIKASAAAPPETLDAEAVLDSSKPDVVMVDYQLSAVEPGRKAAQYRGSTLAAVLREKLPDRPIILMTRHTVAGAGS